MGWTVTMLGLWFYNIQHIELSMCIPRLVMILCYIYWRVSLHICVWFYSHLLFVFWFWYVKPNFGFCLLAICLMHNGKYLQNCGKLLYTWFRSADNSSFFPSVHLMCQNPFSMIKNKTFMLIGIFDSVYFHMVYTVNT